MSESRSSKLALLAAGQAANAVAELVRFATEGASVPAPFGEVEVIELDDAECDDGEIKAQAAETRGQLRDALVRFLEGWA